jgi:hypothetical protein
MLIYPLLGESGLGLCCVSVNIGKRILGNSIVAMLLTLRAVIISVGHYILYCSISCFIAGNADVTQELTVFDRDFSDLEFLFLLRDLPTNILARAFIVNPEA